MSTEGMRSPARTDHLAASWAGVSPYNAAQLVGSLVGGANEQTQWSGASGIGPGGGEGGLAHVDRGGSVVGLGGHLGAILRGSDLGHGHVDGLSEGFDADVGRSAQLRGQGGFREC